MNTSRIYTQRIGYSLMKSGTVRFWYMNNPGIIFGAFGGAAQYARFNEIGILKAHADLQNHLSKYGDVWVSFNGLTEQKWRPTLAQFQTISSTHICKISDQEVFFFVFKFPFEENVEVLLKDIGALNALNWREQDDS